MSNEQLDQKHYAGFWIRFFACIVDVFLCSIFYFIILWIVGKDNKTLGTSIYSILSFFSWNIFLSSRFQATPGMYLFKIRITDRSGRKITFWRASAWQLIVFALFSIFCAGLLYGEWKYDLKALDMVAEQCKEKIISPKVCLDRMSAAVGMPIEQFWQLSREAVLLTLVLYLIWMLSVALTKEKTGFHNILCGTRFLKGRPVSIKET